MASSSDDSGSEDEQYFSATDDESEDEDKKTINNSANAKKNSSSNPISKGKEGEEVEFIVKNLDTGESISSKEIDKKIMKGVDPKDLDPLSYNLLKRTSAPSEEVPRKRSIFNSVKAVKKFKKRKKATKKKLFAQICRQTIKQHTGSIWVMKFNYDGTLLATGGHDQKICIWQVVEEEFPERFFSIQPLILEDHTGDILDLSWSRSRSNLLLSASMDKTVKLWDVSNLKKCLYSFDHGDVVTSVVFHPKNEELFITGSLDDKLRLWNRLEKSIVCIVVVDCGFITSLGINSTGDLLVVGSYDGKCSFYDASELKLKSQHQITSKSKERKRGKKITGLDIMPGGRYVLISSNDSRIRLYDTKDYSMICRYRGLRNNNFQIYATFSENGKYIICGSEDQHVYIWETKSVKDNFLSRTPHGNYYDSFQAHPSTISVAIFAPFGRRKTKLKEGQIVVTCDTGGEIKVFENKVLEPKGD